MVTRELRTKLFALVMIAALVGFVLIAEYRWRKGWEAQTLYSRSYDERKFKQTSEGEDAANVLTRLGPPISVMLQRSGTYYTVQGAQYRPDARDEWTVLRYTEPRLGDNRVVRDIRMRGNKVTGIQADTFCD
jgi:hypothetical protein